ncbi:MAG TPA: phosphotransferase [Solirubrobacteraceae bacterium]|nr:phosphotransferase [Solirubrobacteraceae bacterium]
MRTALHPDLLARIEAHLGRAAGDPVALEGGITNRNYRVRFGERDAVVRLCGEQAAALGIDRRTEAIATQRAADLGIGPEVLVRLEDDDVLVCGFVTGAAMTAAGVRGRLGEIARALRAFHETPPLPTAFDVYELIARQRAIAGVLPADYEALLATAARIRHAFGDRPDHVPVPCHNDLLAANFLAEPGGGGVRILDWEYAGNNDRCFDLGNLAVNNALDDDEQEALLHAYWEGDVTTGRRAALALMRFVSDFREAMWGAAQQTLSDLDVDYVAYADEHFARLRATASDPRMEGWLHDAAAA